MSKNARATNSDSKSGYNYVGRTSDGVRIIEPRVRAKHFTREEIREAIERVLARRGIEHRAMR
jgi:hypothetical protein